MWVPDAAHEALRDLVRAREAAKKDELRARHRLNKFLLRQGRRPPMGIKLWTIKYLEWVKQEVHFEQMAQEATLLDYLHEVEHAAARIARLDGAIAEAVKLAPPKMRAVIEGSYGGHPALRSTASSGSRSVLAISSFRFRARLDVSIPSAFSGQRGYEPRFWIWRPSFERQRDFNPPEQRAAQRALPACRPLARNGNGAPHPPFAPRVFR